MNKYLEKIADKIELEPGVYYNLGKHDLTVSKGHMSDHLDGKDRQSRLTVGGMYAPVGAFFGGGFASQALDKRIYAPYPAPSGSVTGKTNLLGRLVNRFGPTSVHRAGAALGVLAGAGVAGGIGYGIGGLQSLDRSMAKDSYLAKLEKKHENRINELEGWG